MYKADEEYQPSHYGTEIRSSDKLTQKGGSRSDESNVAAELLRAPAAFPQPTGIPRQPQASERKPGISPRWSSLSNPKQSQQDLFGNHNASRGTQKASGPRNPWQSRGSVQQWHNPECKSGESPVQGPILTLFEGDRF